MRNLQLYTAVFASLSAVAVAAGCASDGSPDATLKVRNDSDFQITEIHVTGVGNATWGPNLLGGDTLAPGESLVLGVDCGTYDALLVDEQGVDCEIHDVDLCLNDAHWIIGNNTCAVFGAAKAARDAAAAKANPPGAASPTDAGSR